MRRGFTLIELAVVVSLVVLVGLLVAPSLNASRRHASKFVSQRNMAQLAAATASYGVDFDGKIPNFTWTRLTTQPFSLMGGCGDAQLQLIAFAPAFGTNAFNLQARQIILDRSQACLTGLITQVGGNATILPHRRWYFLTVTDYLSGVLPDPAMASPEDGPLLAAAADAQDGGPQQPVLLGATLYADPRTRAHFPYASSYLPTTYAFANSTSADSGFNVGYLQPASTSVEQVSVIAQFDGTPVFFPNQLFSSVAFPSQKAYYFEEYDWLRSSARHFSYPDAWINVAAFDGSVQRRLTADAVPGWDPSDPRSGFSVPLPYQAIDDTLYPPTTNERNPQPYRWTRNGLAGIDWAAQPSPLRPATRRGSAATGRWIAP